MKHCFMFLLGIFLSATLCGQNYSSEVVFLQQQKHIDCPCPGYQ